MVQYLEMTNKIPIDIVKIYMNEILMISSRIFEYLTRVVGRRKGRKKRGASG